MHDHSPPDDTGRSGCHGDDVQCRRQLHISRGVGAKRRQVSGMTVHCHVASMRLTERIEVPARAHAVTRAAIALVVYMKTVFRIWFQSADIRVHANFIAHLREFHGTGHAIALGCFEFGDGNRMMTATEMCATREKRSDRSEDKFIFQNYFR